MESVRAAQLVFSAARPVVGANSCQDDDVGILGSRILLRPADRSRNEHFYRDVLGLAIYREFGPPVDRGVVFFLGSGFMEVSGPAVPGSR